MAGAGVGGGGAGGDAKRNEREAPAAPAIFVATDNACLRLQPLRDDVVMPPFHPDNPHRARYATVGGRGATTSTAAKPFAFGCDWKAVVWALCGTAASHVDLLTRLLCPDGASLDEEGHTVPVTVWGSITGTQEELEQLSQRLTQV